MARGWAADQQVRNKGMKQIIWFTVKAAYKYVFQVLIEDHWTKTPSAPAMPTCA